MWFSGHGILRSKGGHWGNIKRGDSQQTESSVCCVYLHTHGSTVGVCVEHVSGWERQPAGRRDHQEQAENVFVFFSHIYFFALTRGGGWWERDAVAVRWNQWQNQSLMHGTVQVLHRGGLERSLHPIQLPHGDDAAVVTTGRCHFPRIFLIFILKTVVWCAQCLVTKGNWWMSRFALNGWEKHAFRSFLFLGVCCALLGEVVK